MEDEDRDGVWVGSRAQLINLSVHVGGSRGRSVEGSGFQTNKARNTKCKAVECLSDRSEGQ